MYAKRRVTGATSRSFGHEDTFGKFVDDGLENKVCIPLDDAGGWAEGPKLWTLEQVGPLPPGALAYVRVKAATICRAGRDLEFHQLAGAAHLSGDTEAWLMPTLGLKKIEDSRLRFFGRTLSTNLVFGGARRHDSRFFFNWAINPRRTKLRYSSNREYRARTRAFQEC